MEEVSSNRLEYDAKSMVQDSDVNPEDVGSSFGDSRGALAMASKTPTLMEALFCHIVWIIICQPALLEGRNIFFKISNNILLF